jgi:hypothetical protein
VNEGRRRRWVAREGRSEDRSGEVVKLVVVRVQKRMGEHPCAAATEVKVDCRSSAMRRERGCGGRVELSAVLERTMRWEEQEWTQYRGRWSW